MLNANCLLRRQFAWSARSYFLGKIIEIASVCRLLNMPIAWYMKVYMRTNMKYKKKKKKKTRKMPRTAWENMPSGRMRTLKSSDQPLKPTSLIRAIMSSTVWCVVKSELIIDSEGCDQTVQMWFWAGPSLFAYIAKTAFPWSGSFDRTYRKWFPFTLLTVGHWNFWNGFIYHKEPGPSCSKLTMSLVNVVKTLTIKYGIYANIFAEKNVSSFCICKSYSHFSAKIQVN